MRQHLRLPVRSVDAKGGVHITYEECVVWTGELPPMLLRKQGRALRKARLSASASRLTGRKKQDKDPLGRSSPRRSRTRGEDGERTW
jgi:hypothetical protein